MQCVFKAKEDKASEGWLQMAVAFNENDGKLDGLIKYSNAETVGFNYIIMREHKLKARLLFK